jgi:hypothetical protein
MTYSLQYLYGPWEYVGRKSRVFRCLVFEIAPFPFLYSVPAPGFAIVELAGVKNIYCIYRAPLYTVERFRAR